MNSIPWLVDSRLNKTIKQKQMAEFKQYAVIAFPDLESLVKEVNMLLARGWTPLGGLTLKTIASETVYFQSMAK